MAGQRRVDLPSAEQPQKLQFNAYTDNNPKGFGLLQLDRDFSHYQDIMGWYNKRPSLWVEPRNKWGKGTIGLMEFQQRAKRWITLSASGSQKKL